ncbi:hypothetical protein OHA98_21260 [Streptomyces sp. NBC_00654]|uniref:hypothetical protein n=1 Tax=Streptomyces sp. NBC_00654 TaxID=2975799 RepID=UPI00224D9226|nr:hypothetical protein [Streptomyces sp. NBC_00654]MCX4967249.1 hypothetical protein [Streptomyces sp. NBC_00654]
MRHHSSLMRKCGVFILTGVLSVALLQFSAAGAVAETGSRAPFSHCTKTLPEGNEGAPCRAGGDRSAGEPWRASKNSLEATAREGPIKAETPKRLQFRLLGFRELASTDTSNDEVWLAASGLDSSAVTIGKDRKPVVDLIQAPMIGDVSDNRVRGPWAANPHELIDFDLQRPGDYPRTYTVTLYIVEENEGELGKAFDELRAETGGKIREVVQKAATAAAATAAGAAIGSAIPGVGTVVGAAVGALAGVTFDALADAISAALNDEIFPPVPLTLTVPNPALVAEQGGVGDTQTLTVKKGGAHYEIDYDWHVVTAPAGNPPPVPDNMNEALDQIGVDFSVPESTMRDWLANPSYTPYPAIAQALLNMGRKFKSPIYLDVIVWKYEHAEGVKSPRIVSDVKTDILKQAVLAASNERYGTELRDFEQLLK